jgi:hypothetical protein
MKEGNPKKIVIMSVESEANEMELDYLRAHCTIHTTLQKGKCRMQYRDRDRISNRGVSVIEGDVC